MTPTQTATPSKTTTWQVDPAHTHVEFAVKHLVATVGVASIDTREPQRDGHLKSPDFFDVEKHPTMTFRSRRVESTSRGADRYRLVGDLTLHGVTKEILLEATLEGLAKDPYGNERAGFSAKGAINRKDFGLAWNQVLETGGVLVGDEVKIAIDAEIIRR